MALIPTGNRLLATLDPKDREALAPHLSTFAFPLGNVFGDPGDVVGAIHFVDSGIISAVAMMQDGRSVEAYMVGSEGFTGSTAWLVPFHTSVRYVGQVAGTTQRIDAKRLREQVNASPSLRATLATYDAALQAELQQSTACNAIHYAEQRFAKWLLRAHDRVQSNVLNMTQEFLANMLGSQRTTVNEAAQNLSRDGAIAYSRGKVTILDRAKLESRACECYDSIRGVADRA